MPVRLHLGLLALLASLSLLAGCRGAAPLPARPSAVAAADTLYLPERDLGPLFEAVQLAGVFPDSKTFTDMRPLTDPDSITVRYLARRDAPGFDLAAFVEAHFAPPETLAAPPEVAEDVPMAEHIRRLWPVLTRRDDAPPAHTSLIPLPEQYVVPGGRFREIYYWDSFFTQLGLVESGRLDLVESMVENFAYLIRTLGFIPNGNRTYYLTRSQPPFFPQMVMLLAAETDTAAVARRYLDELEREYGWWMAGADVLLRAGEAAQHVVRLEDGVLLNRYWDRGEAPRPESYREDYELAQRLPASERPRLYRDLRSAAESGWDFSSRWLRDPEDLATIHTTEIVPVDLNALLYGYERVLSELSAAAGAQEAAGRYATLAERRADAIRDLLWDEERGAFMDYDFRAGVHTDVLSLATVYPLYFGIATPEQARRVAAVLEAELLGPGGLASTPIRSGQQWDAPNGWAPLQWLAFAGLERYGHGELASEVRARWLALNRAVYERTGKMMEKYDVLDLSRTAGGGEYPTQDGFGWTNGVDLALIATMAPVPAR